MAMSVLSSAGAVFAASHNIYLAAYNSVTGETLTEGILWYVTPEGGSTTSSSVRSLDEGTKYSLSAAVTDENYIGVEWRRGDPNEGDVVGSANSMNSYVMGTQDVYFYYIVVPNNAIRDDMIKWGNTEFICDDEPHAPSVTIKDGDYVLKEGVDYNILYLVDEEPEPSIHEPVPTEVGNYIIQVQGIENYCGYVDKKFKIIASDAPWGRAIQNNGIINYVDAAGTTSAEVKDNGVSWLKEESNGTSAWYGVDNQNGAFAQGSRFWVRWLDANDNKDDFSKYYNNLDDEHKIAVDDGKIRVFLIGVTSEQGAEYVNINGGTYAFIQLGDDWGDGDYCAVFISEDGDEPLSVQIINNYMLPNGTVGTVAKIKLAHFSPYVLYKRKSTPTSGSRPPSNLSPIVINPTSKKRANPLKVKAKAPSVKYSKLKKKSQKLAITKAVKFVKAGQGKMSYAKVKGNKKITINKKTGKITVKKGLKKGRYKVTVKIKAGGNAVYKPSAAKKVTFKITVK